jgi:hypothetical protein
MCLVGSVSERQYIKGIAEATHEVGGIFCLDGIASGNAWVDMGATLRPYYRRRAFGSYASL